jgi:uncharacterized protein with PQ loop repeat
MDQGNFYYYSVLLTILLQSFAFIPLIAEVYKTGYSANIPFSTLLMLFLAALLLLIVAIYRGYYTHIIIFLVYFASIAYLLMLKIQNLDTR